VRRRRRQIRQKPRFLTGARYGREARLIRLFLLASLLADTVAREFSRVHLIDAFGGIVAGQLAKEPLKKA